MTTEQFCIIAAIVIYLLGMVYVGFYFSRKGGGSSSDEFYLGGRKLGPIVTAMSAEASDMSSWLLMGLPGVAYLCGIADAGWTAIGLAVGTYLNWLIVAKRLRRYSTQLGAITIPSFFSLRYRDERHVLTCIAAILILIFFIPYTASGFKAVGTLFNSLFGVDYHTAMIVGAIVIIGYTVLGGFLAVSTTDLIQSIVMSIALVVIVFFGIQQAGGWEAVLDHAAGLSGYLSMTQSHDAASGAAVPYGGLSILSTLAWGLGYFGMPHILLRFMAIQDEGKLRLSRRIASIWVVISMRGAGGHPGLHHVYRRLSAAHRRLQRIPESAAGRPAHPAERQGRHAGRPRHGHCHCRGQRGAGLGPQQLGIYHRLLRMGGLRGRLRPGSALCPVLEAQQPVGRAGRHGGGRRDGVSLEVPDPSPRRRVGPL